MFKWRKSKGVQASFNSQVCSALREFWLSGGSNHLYLSSSKFLLHPQRQCVHKLDKAHGGCDVCYQCTECRSFLYSLHSLHNPIFFQGRISPEKGAKSGFRWPRSTEDQALQALPWLHCQLVTNNNINNNNNFVYSSTTTILSTILDYIQQPLSNKPVGVYPANAHKTETILFLAISSISKEAKQRRLLVVSD